MNVRKYVNIDFIRYSMLALGYTERTMAKKCGLSLNMLNNILHNRAYQFTEKNLMKIITFLQLDWKDCFYFNKLL